MQAHVVALIEQAERLAALGAFARAAEIYGEALARLPEDDAQRAALLAALADMERRQTQATTTPPPAEPEWSAPAPPFPPSHQPLGRTGEAAAGIPASGAAGGTGEELAPGAYRAWLDERPPVRSGLRIWQAGLALLAGSLLLVAVVRIWGMAAAALPPAAPSPIRTRTATASPSPRVQPTASATAPVVAPPATATRPAPTATTTATRTATLSPTPSRTPAVTPTAPPVTSGRRIVYVSEQSGSPQLWLMNGDGGQKRQITKGGANTSPSWSPDNRYIYYLSRRDGRSQIYRYIVSSGSEEPVLKQGGYSRPQLLPDGELAYRQEAGGMYRLFIGKKEVFVLNRPFIFNYSAQGDRMLIEPEGDPLELLVLQGRSGKAAVVAPARSWNGAWGPHGELLYVSDREGVAFIYVARSDGTEGRLISPADKWSQAPAWSPNGDWIAFVAADGQRPDWNLYVMTAGGEGRQQIGRAANPNKSPLWSPESRRILFESDRAGNWDIWSTTTGGVEMRLTNSPADEYDPAWSF